MSNNDFRMDIKAVGNVSENISKRANEYLRLIDETTAIVDELGGHWEGQTYQTFRDTYYSHLASLEELNTVLVSLSNELSAKVESTRSSLNQIKSILK